MRNQVDHRRRGLLAFMTVHRLSARKLCAAAGLSPSAITQFLNDTSRDMISRTWEQVAAGASKLLGRDVSVAELQGDKPAPLEVELRSYIGAGAEILPFDSDGSFDAVEAPPGFNGIAMLVRGDSGSPMFDDGDVIYLGPSSRDVARFAGRVVAVQVKDGPRLVKRLLRGSRKGRWDLQSINPANAPLADRVLVEAAPIRWIRKHH